jgi:hypothetical protein
VTVDLNEILQYMDLEYAIALFHGEEPVDFVLRIEPFPRQRGRQR